MTQKSKLIPESQTTLALEAALDKVNKQEGEIAALKDQVRDENARGKFWLKQLTEAKKENERLKEEKKGMKYSIIYTDPPWRQSKGGIRKARPQQERSLDYHTLSISDIKDIQISSMKLCEENHACFMWTIDKFLHESELMMKELGYKLHARFIWDKENGVAPAFTIRYSHEYLLWFYKGKMQPISITTRGKYTTVIREISKKHSQKPASAYRMIEELYPNSLRLEMYARNIKDGWDAWGDEIESAIHISGKEKDRSL
jgi:N6-adenosine-specific RNA methylase IME4